MKALRVSGDDLVDLVRRVEKAVRRSSVRNVIVLARLDARSTGSTRLWWGCQSGMPEGVKNLLADYHQNGRQFPVYLIPIGPNYKLAGEVKEVRVYSPQRQPHRHETLIVTHPLR